MSKLATRQVPKTALQFDATLQFAEAGGDSSLYPISMLGRSAQPIFHWYWGKVVHDMAGFSTSHPKVAIDYRHDDDEPIGYLDKFTADNSGLQLSGNLVSLNPNDPKDRVAQLKKLADAGVPFQSSIFFETSKLENVQPGASAEVNGYTVEGPAIIIRQWSLRGMAVCLYGADGRTTSKFSDSQTEVPIPCFVTEPTAMTTKKLSHKAAAAAAAKKLAKTPPKTGKQPPAANKFAGKNKQADEQDDDEMADDEEEDDSDDSTEGDDADADAEEEDEDEELADDSDESEAADDDDKSEKAKKHSAKSGKSKSRTELKKYIEAFGHKNGAEWFAEGLDFTSALTKHCSELSHALSAKDAEIAELNKKLKAVNRGEKQPLQLSHDKDTGGSNEPPKEFAHLGNGIGSFAAGLKMPNASKN